MSGKILTLQRVYNGPDCTLGVLLDENLKVFCVTLEDPWNNNKTAMSCIPEGIYTCEHFDGFKFKNVWILKDVEGRSYILIHSGNTAHDTLGCILLGQYFKDMNGEKLIINSKPSLDKLRDYIGVTKGKLNSFKLKIERI